MAGESVCVRSRKKFGIFWQDRRLHPYQRGLGETGELRSKSLACPRLRDDFKKRPDTFWREGNSNPFHHGSLLTKIRPIGLLSAISPLTVRMKILQELEGLGYCWDSGGLVWVKMTCFCPGRWIFISPLPYASTMTASIRLYTQYITISSDIRRCNH